jgi:CheY-like chemotaxis protein
MDDRILIVDDNTDIADTLAKLLATLGYEAKAVYGGQQALESVADFHPDMAFIDIGMPGLNGYEVVQKIRQQRSEIHAILVALTGHSQADDIQQAYNSGFDLHVAKPMGLDKLQELLTLLDPSADVSNLPAIQKYRFQQKQENE